jgi:hypothetical protein
LSIGTTGYRTGAAALGRFFEELLANEDGWSQYWWIDEAQPEQTNRVDESTVEMAGISSPGDERRQWIQPFKALLRLDGSRSRLAAYRVWLGDAAVAIDPVAYGAKHPSEWPNVTEWSFHFEGGGTLST